MRSRPRSHRARPAGAAAIVAALVGTVLGLPTPAIGAPQYATPDPGSPAGTEYGLPFQNGRGAGDGAHHGGGPVGSVGGGGTGGTGGGGGTGATGSGGPGALFGAGIGPAGHARGSGGSASRGGHGGSGAASGGSGRAVSDAGLSARAVADRITSQSSSADDQVWLIVAVLLGGAAVLAGMLRLIGRRSTPAGA